jgi:hypothetical protein
LGGKHGRSSLGGQNEAGLLSAELFLWVYGVERRRLGRLDGWEGYDYDGFWVAEGGRNVEAQIEGICRREGEGGDVLEMCGME